LASRIGKAFSDLKKYQIQNCANFTNDLLNKIVELEESFNNLPEFVRLWTLLEPEANDINTKFAALVQNMHDRGMGWQSHHFRVQNLAIDRLKKKLVAENTGTDAFLETEKLLINMQDLKLKNQINELRIGEVLNSEKPSRHFLDIAKCKNTGESLDYIKKDCGGDFECQNDRVQYISQFYETLYKRTETAGTIEDFLGPHICNSELVMNSKLTDEESANLDRPLTIEELDISLQNANFKSAPGEDKSAIVLSEPFGPCCEYCFLG
jgi:hypothetical protein